MISLAAMSTSNDSSAPYDIENSDDLTLQADEIEALSAIYCDEWKVEDPEQRVYSIRIEGPDADKEKAISLQIRLPPDYPTSSPPIYELSAPWMKREEKLRLSSDLEDIYCDHIGESIIHLWIEKLRDYVMGNGSNAVQNSSLLPASACEEDSESILPAIADLNLDSEASWGGDADLPIYHGEPFTEKRSTFQAHLAPVVTTEQVKHVMERLKANRKIASATHNIMAYRIFLESSKSFIQDCDDDGETHAGSRLLHLLEILQAQNVLVVVSRWYGGILLGPNRFKHINNAARNILQKCGYISEQKSGGSPSTRTK